ncbi:MAG: hypothetical protein ACYDD4_08935, partial [Acidimicrobiales bacterium]
MAKTVAPHAADPATHPSGATAGGFNRARTLLGHFPAEQLIEDFQLSCLSRALDDREIMLQKQSRVYFQISGAGHEILLTALARSLRSGYDW